MTYIKALILSELHKWNSFHTHTTQLYLPAGTAAVSLRVGGHNEQMYEVISLSFTISASETFQAIFIYKEPEVCAHCHFNWFVPLHLHTQPLST